ncbi:hypothetical protein D3C85_1649510 [compost metagenome]
MVDEATKERGGARGRLLHPGAGQAPLQQPAGAAADEGPGIVVGPRRQALRDQDCVHGADQVRRRLDQGSVQVESDGRPVKGGEVGHGAEFLFRPGNSVGAFAP